MIFFCGRTFFIWIALACGIDQGNQKGELLKLNGIMGVKGLELQVLRKRMILLSQYSFAFRSKTAVLTDERIKMMNEIISGMRVIKMYTWEESFTKLVAEIRRYSLSRRENLWLTIYKLHILGGSHLLETICCNILQG